MHRVVCGARSQPPRLKISIRVKYHHPSLEDTAGNDYHWGCQLAARDLRSAPILIPAGDIRNVPGRADFSGPAKWKNLQKCKKAKTINIRDSLVVTHPTTSLTAQCFSTAERTGSPIFIVLWSIAKADGQGLHYHRSVLFVREGP